MWPRRKRTSAQNIQTAECLEKKNYSSHLLPVDGFKLDTWTAAGANKLNIPV